MAINLFVNVASMLAELFANNVHVTRSLDANPHGVGTDANNRDCHVITNQNLFAWLSREHQHTATPFLVLNDLPCFVLRGLNQSPPQTSLLATIGRYCHQLEYDIRRITALAQENLVQSENSAESLPRSLDTSQLTYLLDHLAFTAAAIGALWWKAYCFDAVAVFVRVL